MCQLINRLNHRLFSQTSSAFWPCFSFCYCNTCSLSACLCARVSVRLKIGFLSCLVPLAPKFNSAVPFHWDQHQFQRWWSELQDSSPGKGRLWAAPPPASSRLSLYTLDWLLIVEQIAALKPDTVLAAQKSLTGLSWINNWDPNIALHGSWLVFVQLPPAQGEAVWYWTVPGLL